MNKNDFINLLTDLGFKEEYRVCSLNPKLKQITNSDNVILSKSNLAYCLMRHGKQYDSPIVFDQIKDVINNYDYCIKGKSGRNDDLAMIKIFERNGDRYGLEIKMNKILDKKDEYIVHFLQIKDRNNKLNKLVRKYENSNEKI